MDTAGWSKWHKQIIQAYTSCEYFIRKDHFEDIGVDERIILKYIFKILVWVWRCELHASG
jgi:hypothetical protein